jgi:hypothetical protein
MWTVLRLAANLRSQLSCVAENFGLGYSSGASRATLPHLVRWSVGCYSTSEKISGEKAPWLYTAGPMSLGEERGVVRGVRSYLVVSLAQCSVPLQIVPIPPVSILWMEIQVIYSSSHPSTTIQPPLRRECSGRKRVMWTV